MLKSYEIELLFSINRFILLAVYEDIDFHAPLVCWPHGKEYVRPLC